MEVSQRSHFRYEILLKMMIFFLEKMTKKNNNNNNNIFLIKILCDKLTKIAFESKMPKFLESHVKTHV